MSAKTFHNRTCEIMSVVFSLDERRIISGFRCGTIEVCDTETGLVFCELRGHEGTVSSLALSPDGCRIALGSKDRTIRMWDLSGTLLPSARHAGNAKTSSPEWVSDYDGWIWDGRDTRDLLALWIPPDLRTRTLWRPRNTAIPSCDFSTKLDFTGAALGEPWTECFVSPSESGS